MFGWGNGPDLDAAPKRLAVADYFSVIGLDVHYPPEVCEPAKHGLAALSKARRHFVADCIIVNVKDKETVPADYEACEQVRMTCSASSRAPNLPHPHAHADLCAHTVRFPAPLTHRPSVVRGAGNSREPRVPPAMWRVAS